MKTNYNYQKLEVYPVVLDLVKEIYKICHSLPQSELFGISSQLKRASISSISNIVEGNTRSSFKEKKRFIEVSYGSLIECHVQLQICIELDFITIKDCDKAFMIIEKSSKILSGLRRYYTSKLQS